MSEPSFSSQSPALKRFLSILLKALIPQTARWTIISHEQELATLTGTYEYIVISPRVMGTSLHVQELLVAVQRVCTPQTRVIIIWQARFWQPGLRLLHWLRLVPAELIVSNRFTARDVGDFIGNSGYESISIDGGFLFPWQLPFVSWFYNALLGSLTLIRWIGLLRWAVVRPVNLCDERKEVTVSVIIPCRNERGNIERAVKECPQMGTETELIFVEGGSSDGTLEEIYRVQKAYSQRAIKVLQQTGKGKRNAVEVGFAHATGEILMILDADLTVVPRDLILFYQLLVENKGEFVNGSRLVYPMEKGAMQRLNFLANHAFSWLLSWLLNQRVTDTLCGTKVLYRRDYERMREQNFFEGKDPFGDFDLLFGAAQNNLKIVNLPVYYRARNYGTTQIGEPWSLRRFAYGWVLLQLCWIGFKKLRVRG